MFCFSSLPDEVLHSAIDTPGSLGNTQTFETPEEEGAYQYGSPNRKLVPAKKAQAAHRPIS